MSKRELRFPGCKYFLLKLNAKFLAVVTEKRYIDVFFSESGVLAAQFESESNIEDVLFSDSGDKLVVCFSGGKIDLIEMNKHIIDVKKKLFKSRKSLIDNLRRTKYIWDKNNERLQRWSLNEEVLGVELAKAEFCQYSHAQHGVVSIKGDYIALYFPDTERIKIIRLSTNSEIAKFRVPPFKMPDVIIPCMLGNDKGEYLAICYSRCLRILRMSDLKWVFKFTSKRKRMIKEIAWVDEDILQICLDNDQKMEIHAADGKILEQCSRRKLQIKHSVIEKYRKMQSKKTTELLNNSEEKKKNYGIGI